MVKVWVIRMVCDSRVMLLFVVVVQIIITIQRKLLALVRVLLINSLRIDVNWVFFFCEHSIAATMDTSKDAG